MNYALKQGKEATYLAPARPKMQEIINFSPAAIAELLSTMIESE